MLSDIQHAYIYAYKFFYGVDYEVQLYVYIREYI
jgi:hypothetical protein